MGRAGEVAGQEITATSNILYASENRYQCSEHCLAAAPLVKVNKIDDDVFL